MTHNTTNSTEPQIPEDGYVDLRSDTVTKPTPAMREAMAAAAVGDDVLGEDPTVNALEARAAAIMGKEAAIYTPSGSMANLLGVLTQCAPGESILLSEGAHIFTYESGAIARIGGVLAKTVPGDWAIMTPEALEERLVLSDNIHMSRTTLIAVENTTNRGGGAIYPLERFEVIGALAREHGLRLHCDGARIFNAAVEAGVAAAEYARHVDTISFCTSKGLGAPVGSLLVGPANVIQQARRLRKTLGGGMRQAGVIAAASLYALERHVERLRDDHARARRFREGLEGAPGLAFPMPSPTNMVYVETLHAHDFVSALRAQGVLAMALGPDTIRTVFHLDVDDAGVDRAIAAFRAVAAEREAPAGH